MNHRAAGPIDQQPGPLLFRKSADAQVIRLAVAGFLASLLGAFSAQAQSNIAVQQAELQSLLDNVITAIRNNDKATACQLRSQALAILSPNLDAFTAAYPDNNWVDLQTSLQDSVNSCQAKGL